MVARVERTNPMPRHVIAHARAFLATAVILAFSSACAVGPNYHRPAVQTPTDFRALSVLGANPLVVQG